MTSTATMAVPQTVDMAQRLQQIVTCWRGAERGEPLSALHEQCLEAAGRGSPLLPARLLSVEGLDSGTLPVALGRFRGSRGERGLSFRGAPVGRFDAALVPIGPAGAASDRWLLAVEESLAPAEQVAMYGHALGHLLLNRERQLMGQMAPLDPRDGFTHTDTLAELRQVENTRQPVNRQVLEAYPLLAALLRGPEPPPVADEGAGPGLRERLAAAGWRGSTVEAPYVFTKGRIYTSGGGIGCGLKLRADALLRYDTSLPIALVQTRRPGEAREDAEQRLGEYAHERMALPFGYLLEERAVHEFDWTRGGSGVRRTVSNIPRREELWERWTTALGLRDEPAWTALRNPYQVSSGKVPRYYQEAAINRAVVAVLQAQRGLRLPRLLLTMATGTGKTQVAFQIVWKLRRARAVRNVLFLTDRDYLLSQAMDNDFAPFGEARDRIRGEARTSRDVIFATYQAIAESGGRRGLYRNYPRDFFDLVIVDECHRGSADDESNWRSILEHFEGAVQIGLTATPRHTENIQTYQYFGQPVATYSLRRGITDGFLAPYRVRRVLMRPATDAEGRGGGDAEAAGAAAALIGDAGDGMMAAAAADRVETAQTLVDWTEAIAEHLAGYLRDGDPNAKTIVFCVDQEHAEQMRLALERVCAGWTQPGSGYVERIVSEEGSDGKRALGRFTLPDEPMPVIVTTSKLLGTGVDVPTCKNIVLARPVGSMVEFKQIIGRGTRLHEPEKRWFTILDYSGATRHFFDADFDGDPEALEIEVLTPRPAPEAPARVGSDADGVAAEADGAAGGMGSGSRSGSDGDRTDRGIGAAAEGIALFYQPSDATGPEAVLDIPGPLGGEGAARPTGGNEGVSAAADQPDGPPAPPTPACSDSAPNPVEAGVDAQQEATGTASTHEGPARGSAARSPTTGRPAVTRTRPSDGHVIRIVGEIVYELGPDGATLRQLSYGDFTKEALEGLCAMPADLRARWLQEEQREEIRGRLQDAGVDLDELAAALGLRTVDPLDLLLHVGFGLETMTRRDRAERARRAGAQFFERCSPAAREVLEVVLEKYAAGEAPDVSDTGLLKVPPLSERGTFFELAQRFGGGPNLRASLRELRNLLYLP